ncbi:MAG: permease prefix domain 1-containing protein [Lachnospiraceae bacterium]|nr:permease prefix domain 1-containing protein [Lachnospiraceae bacterium]
METIKNYLETMFAKLPNTPEVRKAKAELLQMMEDKYNELIDEGNNENTAVGTVISEFGNLDELAESLGLSKLVEETKANDDGIERRNISLEEVKDFISCRTRKAMFLALGILLIIVSIASPILFSSFSQPQLGVTLMFVLIALGVGSIIYSSFTDYEWKFIDEEPCSIDISTAKYVKDQRKSFEAVRALSLTTGIVLCIICWVPNIIFSTTKVVTFGPSLMFLLIGLGVYFIVYPNSVASAYEKLLELNGQTQFTGKYNKNEQINFVKYKSKKAETIVELYWPTVTCIYLIVSFLTFAWGITWIIWPIAGVAHKAVVINCQADDE